MLILSQDKSEIFNFNEIFRLCIDTWSSKEFATESDCWCIKAEKSSDNMICAFLGEYDTEERAKEILQGIIETYKENGTVKIDNVQIENKVVYEMPEKIKEEKAMAFDLDEEEFEATRKLNGADRENKLEEKIKIYYELTNYKNIIKSIDIDFFFDFIERLLQDYTRQKQINEEHQKINAELLCEIKELDKKNDELLKDLYSANCIIADLTDSISKQNIKDKIKELKEDKESKYYDSFLEERDIEITVQILQELLPQEEIN